MNVIVADYDNPIHHRAIQVLMNHYAQDPMGGSESLSDEVLTELVNGLKAYGKAFTILAFDEEKPVGLINCLEGYSTFKAKPLFNVHDVIVRKNYRSQGTTQKMLAKVEEIARAKGCCKLTLEVLEGNHVAQGAYSKFGFVGYELDPKMGKAMFWQKSLI